MTAPPLTARRAGLVACHTCDLLSPLEGPAACPRCGAALHSRKPASVTRTWALLIAAAILYVPANLLPVMSVTLMGQEEGGTILRGVLTFLQEGSWFLAALIFFASIVVPLAKLAIFTYLLLSIQRRSRWKPEERLKLYRLAETIGRWSMVDIYVVTLMVALVNLGSMASIQAGPGATAFAAVVILTLLAASTFDPRLIWDAMEPAHD